MAFVNGFNPAFGGQLSGVDPSLFNPAQGGPLTAGSLPPLNFQNQGQGQFGGQPGFNPNFQLPQGFNPLVTQGIQPQFGGGPNFAGSGRPIAQAGAGGSPPGGGNFMDTLLQMQFGTGDLIGGAMGIATDLSNNNNPLAGQNVQQLGQQFQQVFGQMQQQEQTQGQQSLDQYNSLKDSIFTTNHYEGGPDGQPRLAAGAETTQQRAQRLQYERRQSMAVEQSFARNPLNQRIQAMTDQLTQATKAGAPPQVIKGMYLQLDAAQTALALGKQQAHMQAEGVPIRGDQDVQVNAQAQSLADFGKSAISDYAQMHFFNMQQLASNPITDQYLNAMAAQKNQIAASQQHMTTVSQQMLGTLQGLSGSAQSLV